MTIYGYGNLIDKDNDYVGLDLELHFTDLNLYFKNSNANSINLNTINLNILSSNGEEISLDNIPNYISKIIFKKSNNSLLEYKLTNPKLPSSINFIPDFITSLDISHIDTFNCSNFPINLKEITFGKICENNYQLLGILPPFLEKLIIKKIEIIIQTTTFKLKKHNKEYINLNKILEIIPCNLKTIEILEIDRFILFTYTYHNIDFFIRYIPDIIIDDSNRNTNNNTNQNINNNVNIFLLLKSSSYDEESSEWYKFIPIENNLVYEINNLTDYKNLGSDLGNYNWYNSLIIKLYQHKQFSLLNTNLNLINQQEITNNQEITTENNLTFNNNTKYYNGRNGLLLNPYEDEVGEKLKFLKSKYPTINTIQNSNIYTNITNLSQEQTKLYDYKNNMAIL